MNRARFGFAATLVGAVLVCTSVGAQNPPEPAPKAPEFKSVLSGKKFTPPIKGQAEVEFTQPVTKREKDKVVTTIRVKNVSAGPIARLTIDETWFDKTGSIVSGGKGTLPQMLQPGEIQTVTIETPWNAKMNGNGYNFTHANGSIKPTRVKTLDDAKEPAAKPAAAAKSTPKKK